MLGSLGVGALGLPGRVGGGNSFGPDPAAWSPRKVKVPTGFGWTPTFDVIEWAPGRFTTNLDPASLKVSTSEIRYVDVATGNDANTGLNPLLPKKSIHSAINLWTNATIYVKAGFYPVANSWSGGVPFGQNQNIIGVTDFTTLKPGRVVSSVATGGLTWTDEGGGIYSTSLAAAPYAVYRTATAASGIDYPVMMSELPGGPFGDLAGDEWFYDAGITTLYVRMTDGSDPTGYALPMKNGVHNGWLNTGLNIYVENIVFQGGGNLRAFFLQHLGTAAFVNCTCEASEVEGLGLQTVAAGVTHTLYAIGCTFWYNYGDGTQQTATGAGTTVRVLEWGCTYAYNYGAGTDQGSTAHFTAGNTAVAMIRINGRFVDNKTQGSADVGGTTTWALGDRYQDETIGAYVGNTGTGWMQGCVFVDNTTDLTPFDAGATINTVDTIYKTTSGAGTVQRYQP